MQKTFTHTVTEISNDKTRLSDYLVGVFPLLTTRKSIKKALIRHEIFVDGKFGHSSNYVKIGQCIEHVKIIDKSNSKIQLSIAYEDKSLLVVNKPAGVKTSGNGSDTIQDALILYGNDAESEDALLAPQLIHRLDRDTVGLLIAAKTKIVLDRLSIMIASNMMQKEYIALVEGKVNYSSKFIDNEIDGKIAKTEILKIDFLDTRDATSLVRVKLHTGRTHQIRKHLLAIGHPIVGDSIYNKNGLHFGRGLFLQAVKLMFNHPIDNAEIALEIPPHKKFLKYMNT